jgi:hypothetical protein
MMQPGEVSAALAGSMALLRGDRQAMTHFDVSLAGFWRSFRVALLLAPTLGLDILVDRALIGEMARADVDLPGAILARVLNYAAGFAVFPLVLVLLAGPLALKASYVPFIVARNWTTIVGIVPLTLASLAYVVGLFGHEAFAFANMVSLAFNLFYAYRVALIAAAVPPGQAAGLVALDLVLTLIVNTLVNRIT